MHGPSTGSGSPRAESRGDRRSRIAASIVALLAAGSIWLSAGIVVSGDTGSRIAALPSVFVLGILAVALPAVAWFAKLRLEHVWPLAISLVLWLPFLPFRIGAGFLLWEGPIERIVWLVVAAGLVAARPPRVPAALIDSKVAPLIAAAAVAVSALIVFSQVRNVIPGGDEPHYLAATQSLLHDADLKVANNYERGEYLDYFPGRLEPHFLKRSAAGEIYSIHAPGVSVIVLPGFAIAGYTGAVWTMVLFAALTAALIWRLALTITESPATAWIAVCAICFSVPFFFHTFTIYPELIGAFCVLAGVWLLVELASGRDVPPRTLVIVGALLAILPWLHSRFAVIAGISGVLIAARLAARSSAMRSIATFLAVPVIAAAAWFAFFYVIWGSPSPTAAYGADTSTSLLYIWRGLVGLLFDQQFGVITTAPIYAMAFVGGVTLFRSRPRLAIELGLVVIPYALAVASYAMWWGGSAAPARFLVAILPIAALPLAAGCASSRTVRAVSLILAVVSAALILPRAFEDNGRFIYNNRSGVDATLRWLSSNVDLPDGLPSVHRFGESTSAQIALVWLAGLGIVMGLVKRLGRRRTNGARFAIAATLLAGATIICLSVTPQISPVVTATGSSPLIPVDGKPLSPALRADRQLVMLERFRPSRQTSLIDPSTFETRTVADLFNQGRMLIIGSGRSLDRVPAGEYVIAALPETPVAGVMRVSVGRDEVSIAEPQFDDLRNPDAPFTLRLPVMARTLNFRIENRGSGDPAAFMLRPLGVRPAASRVPATRAAIYGDARAFFFDEWAYPERDGFWTRANGSATVVIDTDSAMRQSGLPISVTAGAVPTTIRLSTGDWAESFDLAAGQKQEVMLPPAVSGTWALAIRSGAGFRPSEREPGNRDVRLLAAWIAIQ